LVRNLELVADNPRVGSSILFCGTISIKLQRYFSGAFLVWADYALKRFISVPKQFVQDLKSGCFFILMDKYQKFAAVRAHLLTPLTSTQHGYTNSTHIAQISAQHLV
jgi:hypothetical protein